MQAFCNRKQKRQNFSMNDRQCKTLTIQLEEDSTTKSCTKDTKDIVIGVTRAKDQTWNISRYI